jgi:hypothetical protein
MIQFCYYKIPDPESFYETYSVMVEHSSDYVKAGDEVEVTAGVGAFSLKGRPIININGRNISPEADGVAYYKFKAPKNPGKHFVPVEVRFTDQDGRKQTITKSVEYTVIK